MLAATRTVATVRADLTRFFTPRALAIVGASDDATKIGGRPLRYLLDSKFAGQVFPVNPNRDAVLGVRAYREVADIPATIDHAIIAVGEAHVEAALRAAAAKGAVGATIFTSGYAEMGGRGHAAQRRLSDLGRELGVRILGPNCQGFANVADGVIATFSSGIERAGLESGPVAVISQSGVVSAVVYVLVRQAGVGISHWVNTGNESDVDAAAALAFVAQRPEVTTIALALETVRSGDALADAVRAARAAGKRVFVLKAGSSAEGAAASVSHTAAIVGRDDLYGALFAQVGAIRVRTITELVDAATLAARDRPEFVPRAVPPRLGIITNSGGTGILCADAAVAGGLRVPSVGAALRERLARILPPYATPQNPLDLTGHYITHPEALDEVSAAFLESGDVDALLIYLGIIGHLYQVDRIVESFARLARAATLPVVVVWQAGDPMVGARIASTGLPVFDDLDRAVTALARGALTSRTAARSVARTGPRAFPPSDAAVRAIDIARDARRRGRRVLGPAAGRELLSLYGIAVPEGVVCHSADASATAAARLGFPVVAKIDSDEIPHKSDVGGVRVGITTADEAARAYDEIVAGIAKHAPRASLGGVRVERQHGGIELVLGTVSDPVLGSFVSIGPGGVLVEVIADVVMRRLPLDAGDAEAMLDAMRTRSLLSGYRGAPAVDLIALVDVMERWAALASDLVGDIAEAEINPLLAGPDGAVAADVLVSVAAPGTNSELEGIDR